MITLYGDSFVAASRSTGLGIERARVAKATVLVSTTQVHIVNIELEVRPKALADGC